MPERDPEETLRSVRQSLHEESLGHRNSIFNVFSLTLAGLMTVLAGILALGHMQTSLKWSIVVAITLVWVAAVSFMHQQRRKSDYAMRIMRRIETQLELDKVGAYIPGMRVFPEDFTDESGRSTDESRGSRIFSRGDWYLVLTLTGLAVVMFVTLSQLPDP